MSATERTIHFRGEPLVLRSDRSCYLPRRGVLLLADLHLDKGSSFRRAGIPLPEGALEETLRRLESAADACGAERIIVLGDLLHAAEGVQRSLLERIERWRGAFSLPIALVPGNHDRKAREVCEAWRIELLSREAEIGAFILIHDPSPWLAVEGSETLSIGGHLHPAVRLRSSTDAIRAPCFLRKGAGLVLPAFSRATAGVEVSPGGVRYALFGERIVEV